MLEKSTPWCMESMLAHALPQTDAQTAQIIRIAEAEWRLSVYVCQHASVILRQSSVHIKRNTSPPVTTQRYQLSSVCEGNRGWKGGRLVLVCVRNMNVCLHHMQNYCLYLYVGRGAGSEC